ncbi:MAG: methionyl-tRNA formyltransferase [Dehalococcoidia bacterium]
MNSNRPQRFIVAAVHDWNRQIFNERLAHLPGNWTFIDSKDQLTSAFVQSVNPERIFFIHWSWKVPKQIFENYECVAFHMTDLPYGRGGSPLQNLIMRGHRDTKLTALLMTEEFDAGPVYLKEQLALDGTAQDIYERASKLSAGMIQRIIEEDMTPVPQEGEPTFFKRRRPEESEVPTLPDVEALYDFIRMLDADGYPRAFLDHRGFRYEFSAPAISGDGITAKVNISPQPREAP